MAVLATRSQPTGPVSCKDTVDDHSSFAQESAMVAISTKSALYDCALQPKGK